MDILETMRARHSIRAYVQRQVPKEMIEAVLKAAILAPSALNLQPWEFYIVMGEEKNRLSRALLKAFREKQIKCGSGTDKPLPERRSRFFKSESYLETLKQMGLTFEQYVNEGSCDFYGAPTAIVICMDKNHPDIRFLDIGIVLGYILLSAHAFRLATCPIGLIAAYSDEVKDVLSIPENKEVIISIALGYPDQENQLNNYRSSREDLVEFTHWID